MKIISLFASAALLACTVPGAYAGQWNKLTRLEVGETIQVPGATLPPGNYVVKLADSPANRHIVRFFNEDQSKVLATVLAIPNQRMQPTGETELAFYETPAGEPEALRAWFYPGDTFGQEFVYPKQQADQIAGKTQRNVPTMGDEDARMLNRSANPTDDAPDWDANKRVYSTSPDRQERTLDEGFTANEQFDRDPKWREGQKKYGKYGRFSDSEDATRSRTK